MQESTSHCGVESRAAARTNLFLAATLHSADSGHPVKIRDLSATGARIETSHVSEVGDAVTLVRGRLSVAARVSWRAERFCGLSFTSPVSIPAWMTNPVILEGKERRPEVAPEGEVGPGSVAEELTRVSRWLGSLGQTLAKDSGFVFNHGSELKNLRLAVRTLAALAEIVKLDTPQGAVGIGRPDERRS